MCGRDVETRAEQDGKVSQVITLAHSVTGVGEVRVQQAALLAPLITIGATKNLMIVYG